MRTWRTHLWCPAVHASQRWGHLAESLACPLGLPSLLGVLKSTVKACWRWSVPRARRCQDALAGPVLFPRSGGRPRELGLPLAERSQGLMRAWTPLWKDPVLVATVLSHPTGSAGDGEAVAALGLRTLVFSGSPGGHSCIGGEKAEASRGSSAVPQHSLALKSSSDQSQWSSHQAGSCRSCWRAAPTGLAGLVLP